MQSQNQIKPDYLTNITVDEKKELEKLGIADDVENLQIVKEDELEIEKAEYVKLPELKDFEKIKEETRKRFEYRRFITSLVLEELTPNHFVSYAGNPYLIADGAEKFRAPLGIGMRDVKGWIIKEDGTQVNIDDKNAFVGNIKAVRFEGIVFSKVLGSEVYLNGGSEVKDEFRSREEIIFWIKKAQRNFFAYGIKLLLGLNNLSWDELKKYGITQENVKSVEFTKSERITYQQAQELWNLLLEKFEGDENGAKDYLKKTTGKNSPQALTPAQYNYIKAQVVKRKDDWLENAKEHAKKLAPEELSKILRGYGVNTLEEASKLETKQKNAILQAIVKTKEGK